MAKIFFLEYMFNLMFEIQLIIFHTDRKMENNHMLISLDVGHRKLSGNLKYKGISSL